MLIEQCHTCSTNRLLLHTIARSHTKSTRMKVHTECNSLSDASETCFATKQLTHWLRNTSLIPLSSIKAIRYQQVRSASADPVFL